MTVTPARSIYNFSTVSIGVATSNMLPSFAVFVGISLDGFISRADGDIAWLHEANRLVPPGEDCGFAAFMASVDALLIGRKTFDHAAGFETWPFGEKPVYVLSRTLQSLPASVPRTVILISGTPDEVTAQLGAKGHRKVYLDGGETTQAFLAAGLVSEITLTTIPVLIGSGRRIFGALPADVKLTHLSTHAYAFGFVQSRYAVGSDA
jgi:dihydrofolate reductase